MKVKEKPILAFTGKYRFLSNFYPCRIKYEELAFSSAEHAFQAAKTLDHAERRVILGAVSPSEAKRLGRRVELRPDWEAVKESVMEEILRYKFRPKVPLAFKLMETDGKVLVEGNNWNDTIWGACWSYGGAGKVWATRDSLYYGQLKMQVLIGQNKLGKLLMKIKDDLN